jgi:hypothetical protein
LVRPRSEEPREVEACWLRRCCWGGGLWLRLLCRLCWLWLRDGALRSGGRGRGLFFGLLLFISSNELVLLLAERIGDLSTRIAQVEFQDGFADVLMRSRQKIAPLEIATGVPTGKQIDRVPVPAVLLDETGVTKRFVDGRQSALRFRIDDLQQHERAERSFDAVRIVGKQPRPLRHVALDEAHVLVAEVIGLRQRLKPHDHCLARTEALGDEPHQRGWGELARERRQLPEAIGVIDRLDDHD